VGLRFPPSGRVFHATSGMAIDLLKEGCGCKACVSVVGLFFAFIMCAISINQQLRLTCPL
jgi:hypothetical protein